MLGLMLRALVLSVVLGLGGHLAPASAQNPPPGWSKQDMDRFVDAVGDAVAKKLKDEGRTAPPASGARGAPAEDASELIHRVADRVREIFGNASGWLAHVASLPERLDRSQSGGPSFGGFLVRLLIVAALGLLAEWAVRLVTSRYVGRIVLGKVAPPSWPRFLGLTVVEGLALVALGVVGNAAYASLFLAGGEQARIAGSLLMALFWWRFGISVLRCWLRPLLPAGRLAPVGDQDAAAILRGVAIATGVTAASRAFVGLLIATGATRDQIVVYQFIGTPIVIGTFIATVLALRAPVALWIEELMAIRSREAWDGFIARNWYVGGVLFYISLGIAVPYGGISGRIDLPGALNNLQLLLVGWLLVETVLYCVYKRRMQARSAAKDTEPRLSDIAWRGVNILARIAIIIATTRIVTTDILNLIPHSAWAGYAAKLVAVGLILFAAWAVWQSVKFYFEKAVGPERGPVMPGQEDSEEDEEKLEGASRLRTLIPVLKSVIFVLVVGLTALIILSELGVNITPILAGASIFGLALSFGSQALVRDVVSGIFFLADDAFRVGEYIDIGKAKGTVESFTLRSIRLRHQGGQIHTIPFGQLGQITNFSRDWATVKFNLRFARETNVEVLRKAAKKIGQELMEDPEIKDDFLLPLKMQGIADIQDNALIARFKFTVRPGRPSYIQRLAVKRMLQVFPEKGIEFASATVAVKSLDGGPVSADAAAAAARGNAQPVPQTG